MFSVASREQIVSEVLRWATSDPRVVSGAVVGSLAHTAGDRWSDIDLTFAVAEAHELTKVLDEWTKRVVDEFQGVVLFDLPHGSSIYRVFLMPGCLQFDLSFTAVEDFGAIGPNFRLLFGNAVNRPHVSAPDIRTLLGYGAHHVVRARFCIERDRLAQAEYWLSAARDYIMSAACLQAGLPATHGRGFDRLPAEARRCLEDALVRSLERAELMRALGRTVAALMEQLIAVPELEERLSPELKSLPEPLSPDQA